MSAHRPRYPSARGRALLTILALAGCPSSGHMSMGGPTIKSSRGHRVASGFLVAMGALFVGVGATGNIYEENPDDENTVGERIGVVAIGAVLVGLGVHYWIKANRIEDANTRARSAAAVELAPSAVQAGIATIAPRLRACGSGEVTLHVVVAPGGAPSSIAVASASNADLGRCIASALHHARFDAPGGGTFTLPYAAP